MPGISVELVDAFLNPLAFDALGAANLLEGMSRQEGNMVDEFVVGSVRNFLVGLPLDLAAINIARGRDVGLPTLNQVRTEIFEQTGEETLTPYKSWADFGDHLLHPSSLLNFIAAYGTHAGLTRRRRRHARGEARRGHGACLRRQRRDQRGHSSGERIHCRTTRIVSTS